MNDNDIIKALECCGKTNCSKCPVVPFDGKCKYVLCQISLDLINRQKADLENARVEAIKEFAERLHEYINGIVERHEMPMFPFSLTFISGVKQQIDNLAKEMVGDEL